MSHHEPTIHERRVAFGDINLDDSIQNTMQRVKRVTRFWQNPGKDINATSTARNHYGAVTRQAHHSKYVFGEASYAATKAVLRVTGDGGWLYTDDAYLIGQAAASEAVQAGHQVMEEDEIVRDAVLIATLAARELYHLNREKQARLSNDKRDKPWRAPKPAIDPDLDLGENAC